ncbi:nuclear transport factor 2 family protein [Arthrobacter sp. ISL-28]|uniref:nuclear transport factor 2 family protein n=1 Tax=Arthrobacter sp. ISL-28 TaxID=2819108 RepID=UPI001BE666E8|nr:nuclear transport factor 2 family protein [Arthrobacter sp. ISL-28]MBT2523365.1 nuclear transport factor 2 family protein [Arthrobacter sp. ISL-28]
MTEDAQQNKEMIRAWINAYNRQDVHTLRSLFTSDVTWNHQGSIELSGIYSGIDAVVDDFLKPGWALYNPGTLQLSLVTSLAEGSTVAVEFVATGIAAATGRQYRSPYGMFVEVAGGRIREVREYVDTQHAKEVLFG